MRISELKSKLLNSPRLCYGTKPRVISLTKNIIEVEILNGCVEEEKAKKPLYVPQ